MENFKDDNNQVKDFATLLLPLFEPEEEKVTPATEDELDNFMTIAAGKGVPQDVIVQLVTFYTVTNGIEGIDGFSFFACDDETLFEWWDDKELWLGQRDDDVLRWANGKFCLGDASNVSYDTKFEHDTLLQLLKFSVDDWELTQ
ncbi:MAG: hypothetical protein EOO10_23145 [Chitinophagaceae bacterium]|nr:MAG: hypothetical protein EOO10_23145 [Chitinophagaceae bacterium]